MPFRWAKTPRGRSWHIVSDGRTLCGHAVKPNTEADTFPGNAKTCETCLRIEAMTRD